MIAANFAKDLITIYNRSLKSHMFAIAAYPASSSSNAKIPKTTRLIIKPFSQKRYTEKRKKKKQFMLNKNSFSEKHQ